MYRPSGNLMERYNYVDLGVDGIMLKCPYKYAMDCILLAQDMVQWRNIENTVMKDSNVLAKLTTINF
jgi:hypothetical protein